MLEQIKKNPTTYAYELSKTTNYDQIEIDIILTRLTSKK